MRIGFTGAGGTGKTTTASLIAPILGLDIVPSLSRRVFESFGYKEADQLTMTSAQTWELQQALFAAKITQDEKITTGIFDRTLLDHMAYAFFRCSTAMPDSFVGPYLARVLDNLREYDLLFYFPITFVPPPDGFRQQGEAYRHAIDTMICGLLTQTRACNYQVVGPGTPKSRAEDVLMQVRLMEVEQRQGRNRLTDHQLLRLKQLLKQEDDFVSPQGIDRDDFNAIKKWVEGL